MNQSDFSKALLSPEYPIPTNVMATDNDDPERRFAVYRNNVISSLCDAMETGFPAIRNLLGPTNFRNISQLYVRYYPPKSPIMQQFGEDFGLFLQGFEPVQKFPYLCDIAEIEMCLRRSYHAQDVVSNVVDQLGQLEIDKLIECRITFAPSVYLITSNYPIFDIWMKTHQPSHEIRNVAQHVLIVRPEYDPYPILLTAAEAAFFTNLQSGKSFEQSADNAAQIDEQFDLATALQTLIVNQTIHEVNL